MLYTLELLLKSTETSKEHHSRLIGNITAIDFVAISKLTERLM